MRRNLPFLAFIHFFTWGAEVAHAQCPAIFNCPQGSPVVCDISGNDHSLWNDPPYTWSYTLNTEDLYEGATDFSLKIIPCPDGGTVQVSYVLLLDLDNDNLRETAVPSLDLPPIGTVYANNAFNPGYSGGEPVEFDKRGVPDSIKFRFALETTTSWDTLITRLCWQTGSLFVSPRLPEGRHFIIWRIEQDGVVQYCEHSFRIKDCEAPTIMCEPDWPVSLNSNGEALVLLNNLLTDAEDNTTPFPMLEFSMRKSGAGAGFPLDSAGNKTTALSYDCTSLDTQIVELWAKDRLNNISMCEVALTVTDDTGICDQVPTLCAYTFWGAGDVVQPVNYNMIWVDTSQKLITQPLSMHPDGCGILNFLPPVNSFSLTAACDTNPLNGVSTFDLLLISKHILGLEPFDAPWKWLAADANKSGSVTTFDLAELRKLILGIYNKLPNNTSWRFFPSDCVFPNNPFSAYCPPEYSFATTPLGAYPLEIPFNALKTGDVNGTANPVSWHEAATETRGEAVALVLPDMDLQTGEVYGIPIRAEKGAAWQGFQFSLQLDPDVVAFETVQPGVLPDFDANSWTSEQNGVLNFSWISAAPIGVSADDNWMVLRLKALRPARLSETVRILEKRLRAEVYAPDEKIQPIIIRFEGTAKQDGTTEILAAQPNPTGAGVRVPLRLMQPEVVEVKLVDVTGREMFRLGTALDAGHHLVEIPASAFPATGVYTWRVKAGAAAHAGKVVRY